MASIEEDLQIEINGLRYEIKAAKKNIADYSKRHFNSTRENALIFCLQRAHDLAEGCNLLAETKLLTPVYALTQGLLESLIWVRWIALSNENAQAFVDTTANELKRIARKNLATGHAKVVDRVTHEDKTRELLQSAWAKGISPRLKIEDAAKAAGLERLYTQMYGPLSMQTHGTAFGFELKTSVDEEMVSILAVANVSMESINLVVKNWIVERKLTMVSDIYDVLRL